MKYKKLYLLFLTLHILANVAPITIYAIKAMISADLLYEKVALSFTVFTVLIMTIVCLINKTAMKSRLWILLIGLYICLDHIMAQLVVIAVCQILDEILLMPMSNYFKWKARIHGAIEKRISNG